MPAVSIITATYNRSNVLRYAIQSVRRQSFTDWELIVVGDCCTDDTADVVASFGDPRIRFVNLPRNHGEQSGPNNVGASMAAGHWLAFLNHDDLWFSDHLQTLVGVLETSGADLAYALCAQLAPGGTVHMWGHTPGGYAIWHAVPASLWVMRRALVDRVGPWTPATRLWNSPSQDWIRRAHASGARLVPVLRLTVVQISSGHRKDSYRNRDEREHIEAAAALEHEVTYREQLLTAIARDSSMHVDALQPFVHARRAMRAVVWRLCLAVGVPPASAMHLLRFGRRGGFIRHLRSTRGLDPAIGHRS